MVRKNTVMYNCMYQYLLTTVGLISSAVFVAFEHFRSIFLSTGIVLNTRILHIAKVIKIAKSFFFFDHFYVWFFRKVWQYLFDEEWCFTAWENLFTVSLLACSRNGFIEALSEKLWNLASARAVSDGIQSFYLPPNFSRRSFPAHSLSNPRVP